MLCSLIGWAPAIIELAPVVCFINDRVVDVVVAVRRLMVKGGKVVVAFVTSITGSCTCRIVIWAVSYCSIFRNLTCSSVTQVLAWTSGIWGDLAASDKGKGSDSL